MKGPVWNSEGWTLLGETTVNGNNDHDSIPIGRKEGAFDQLTLVVTDSDLQLNDMIIYFGHKERLTPNVKHTFREGQRTRAIDLPGNNRTIIKVDLGYSNIPGGGRAHVQLWGRNLKGR